MIPVARVPEPPDFSAARNRGNEWLAAHPDATRARDYWSPFRDHLAEGFHHLCGYSAMHDLCGSVDHFYSFKTHRHLAYEWSNYRYASAWFNSSKRTREILDPFEIGDGWFEVLIPSFEMQITGKVSPEFVERARNTLEMLNLASDGRLIRLRRTWYQKYLKIREQDGQAAALAMLREFAPLVAAAEEKRLAAISQQT